jgi:tRNA-binding EMAP/Myf-like protein
MFAGAPVEIGDILFVKIDPATLAAGAADGNAAAATPAAAAPAPAAPPKPAKGGKGGENGGGKPKKEKQQVGGKGGAAAAPEEEVDPGNPNALNMVVGKIVKAWPHPDSEKLWCEEIDVGEEVRARIFLFFILPCGV